MLFYPEHPIQEWDNLEIDPMNGEGDMQEECEESEAASWALFIHLKVGGRICIADFERREDAQEFAGNLINLCLNFKK